MLNMRDQDQRSKNSLDLWYSKYVLVLIVHSDFFTTVFYIFLRNLMLKALDSKYILDLEKMIFIIVTLIES